jgi:hypothetical protein
LLLLDLRPGKGLRADNVLFGGASSRSISRETVTAFANGEIGVLRGIWYRDYAASLFSLSSGRHVLHHLLTFHEYLLVSVLDVPRLIIIVVAILIVCLMSTIIFKQRCNSESSDASSFVLVTPLRWLRRARR